MRDGFSRMRSNRVRLAVLAALYVLGLVAGNWW